jgi:hypothetical protein
MTRCEAKTASGAQCSRQAKPKAKYCAQHGKHNGGRLHPTKTTATKKASSPKKATSPAGIRRATTMAQAEANLRFLRSVGNDIDAFDRLVDGKPAMGAKYFVPQKKLVVRIATTRDQKGPFLHGQFGVSEPLGILYHIPATGTQQFSVSVHKPAHAYERSGRMVLGTGADPVWVAI